MNRLGNYDFPTTAEEAKEWKPVHTYVRLNSTVLVAANTRVEGAWKAYCAPVPGMNHDIEYLDVLRVGVEIPEEWARAMFPRFDGVPYAR